MVMDVLSVRILREGVMHGAGTCVKGWSSFQARREKRTGQAPFFF
jgi:hypothetical protein